MSYGIRTYDASGVITMDTTMYAFMVQDCRTVYAETNYTFTYPDLGTGYNLYAAEVAATETVVASAMEATGILFYGSAPVSGAEHTISIDIDLGYPRVILTSNGGTGALEFVLFIG